VPQNQNKVTEKDHSHRTIVGNCSARVKEKKLRVKS